MSGIEIMQSSRPTNSYYVTYVILGIYRTIFVFEVTPKRLQWAVLLYAVVKGLHWKMSFS